MQLTKMSFITGSTALFVANVFGATLYVFAASRGGWAIPEERAAGIYTTAGEPFVWFLNILPVIAISLATNLVWAATILASKNWYAGRLWLLSTAAWVVAVIIDFVHH